MNNNYYYNLFHIILIKMSASTKSVQKFSVTDIINTAFSTGQHNHKKNWRFFLKNKKWRKSDSL